jgi:hypothetical protein
MVVRYERRLLSRVGNILRCPTRSRRSPLIKIKYDAAHKTYDASQIEVARPVNRLAGLDLRDLGIRESIRRFV